MREKKSQLSLLFALTSSVFGFASTNVAHADESVVDVQPDVAVVDLGEVVAEPVEVAPVIESVDVVAESVDVIVDEVTPIEHDVVKAIHPESELNDVSFDKDKADTNQQNAPPVMELNDNVVELENKTLEELAIDAITSGEARLVSAEEFAFLAAQNEFGSNLVLNAGSSFGRLYYEKDGGAYFDNVYILTFDGKWVFCVEPYTQWQSGETYQPSDLTPRRFENRTVSGVPRPYTLTASMIERSEKISKFALEVGGSSAKTYAFTQAMIWETLGWDIVMSGNRGLGGTNMMDTYGGEYGRFKDAVNAKIRADRPASGGSRTIEGTNASFDRDRITLKRGESVIITDTNRVLDSMILSRPSDFRFSLNNEGVFDGIRMVRSGNSLTLTALDTAEVGSTTSFEFSRVRSSTVGGTGSVVNRPSVLFTRTGRQSFARFNYQEKPASTTIYTTSYGRFDVTITEPERPVLGELTIQKVDDTGEAVPGVTFVVQGPDGFIKTATTRPDGLIELSGLKIGTYTIVETDVPAGYIRTTAKRVTISKLQPQVTERIVNERQKGKITIVKYKEGDLDTAHNGHYSSSLAGAVFEIRQNGDVVDRITTNGNATAVSKELELGTYSVVEVTAPKGHVLKTEPIEVVITGDKTNTPVISKSIRVGNEPISGSIKVVKTASDNGEKLEGVVFEVRSNFSGALFGTITTDRNGEGSIENLPLSTYYLVETKTREGFALKPGRTIVRVADDEPVDGVITKVVNITNDRELIVGSLQLNKVDDAGQPVAGVRFTIEGPNGFRREVETATNGQVQLTGLKLGEYTITETSAPAGYIKAGTKFVSITKAQPNVTERIVNDRQKGRITVVKYKVGDLDTANNGHYASWLDAAVFEIRKGSQVVDRISTRSNATAVSKELELGTYTVVEVVPPRGHILDPTPVEVTLTGDTTNELVVNKSIRVGNVPIAGAIKVVKTASDNGEKLEGVVFEVRSIYSGALFGTITTDSKGEGKLENLPLSTYYLVEKKTRDGFVLNPKRIEVRVADDQPVDGVITKTLNITNDRELVVGRLQLNKVDDADQPVSAVRFLVEGPDGFRREIETNERGIAELTGLKPGDYLVTELDAPAGYIKADAVLVAITKERPEVTEKIVNTRQKGKITIVKYKEGDLDTAHNGHYSSSLAGAVFEIRKGNQVVDTITTNGHATAVSKELELGTYTIVETVAPKGHVLNPNPIEVVISGDKTETAVVSKEVRVGNKPISGAIKVVKTAADNGEKLQGVVFEVRSWFSVGKQFSNN